MAQVQFPRLLDPATDGRRSIDVEGDTLAAVIANVVATVPAVAVHLFDHTGTLRPHVLCFVDGASDRLEERDRPVGPDSRVRFLQAVSGG